MAQESVESKKPAPVKAIRVLLADDHNLVRAWIRTLLEKTAEVEVVAEASDGQQAILLVEEHQPDVVLTDIAMPKLNGLEVTRHLAKAFPRIPVLILSMYADAQHVSLALRAGAAGYLLKGAAIEELKLAICAAAQGETYLSPPVAKYLIKEHRPSCSNSSRVKGLTPRQTEVLKLIAEGKTTKQIALDLVVSVKTVESHRMQLMERLEIHDIASLVRYAIRIGLITLED